MRTFKDYLNEAKLPAGVEKFLKGFPLDANGWKTPLVRLCLSLT